ncbi:GTPase-associated protein 1-related protein [Actinoplanes sp. TRM 88003]|uniref:GTPase-associated protein 1-related protein n=1 Tax=Paractinoplanes aksuensis TaxID=2939490 RepID=A0ABT1DPD2_9ACTN|nr:GTPase-associated protein 1-related protein [Actinoplanes aksuensis]MCO8271601.1 GTPase-associated protein 1-related protein [Actinoplanes aksuensis]
MTGRFDTYIYTNCRAGDGLAQRDGFQFQAASPGADRQAMPLVQRRLLYEPSPVWMRERRPVADYPPSFAHVHDGRLWATAAGVYLGRESGGGREGNQLTHAIATDDPRAYGLIRPSQLSGAPFWTTVPAPAQQCPPLDPGWEPGPFGVLEAQRFVLAQHGGRALLTALVSHLRRDRLDPRRVLFLAREPELVLRWITAATLLVPHQQALGIDFKIFTLNPAYADHRILAVHPDWSTGSVNLDNQLGYVVFDLVRHDWTPVTTDPESRRWVELFLAEDPYDIVDAVEIAAAATVGHHAVAATGTSFGLAVVLGRPPEPEAVGGIVDWLGQAPADLVARYGADLVDRLLEPAVQLSIDDLDALEAAASARLPTRAARVRLVLLRAELDEVSRTVEVQPDKLTPLKPPSWISAHENEAVDLLATAMASAGPAHFEILLRLAARFGVTPPHSLLDPGLQRFVEAWARGPRPEYNPRRWADGEEVERKLRRLLERSIVNGNTTAAAVGDLWWETLTPLTQLETALDRALAAAAMLNLKQPARDQLADRMFAALDGSPPPAGALAALIGVLWARALPTPKEARRLLRLLPAAGALTDDHLPALAYAMLQREVSDEVFLVAYMLAAEKQTWQPTAAVARRIAEEQNVRWVLVQLRKGSRDIAQLTAAMETVPQHTVTMNYDRLLYAMVRCPNPVAALAVLSVLDDHPDLPADFTTEITRGIISEEQRPAQMALAFVLHTEPYEDPAVLPVSERQILARLTKAVSDFAVRASAARLESVGREIEKVGGPWPDRWADFLRRTRTRGVLRRIIGTDS